MSERVNEAFVARVGEVFYVTFTVAGGQPESRTFSSASAAVGFADGIAGDGKVTIAKGVLS